jgi:hypothetical protein
MKVKCVDDSGDATHYFKVGGVYEVRIDTSLHYELVGVDYAWLKDRFEVVQESKEPTDAELLWAHKVILDATADAEEERCRALLKPSIASHECACGIARAQCDYHKD